MKEIKILIYILEMCVRIARGEMCHLFKHNGSLLLKPFHGK